jgi:hypothetical protein
LFEKPVIPEKAPSSNQNLERSMMNLYLKEESALKNNQTSKNRLSRSMFNLYEKSTFPENEVAERTYPRSMMNLYEKQE